MFSRVIEDVRAVPRRIAHRRAVVSHQTRSRLHSIRSEGQERWWHLQTRTLEHADDLLDRAVETKGLRHLSRPVSKLVERALSTATELPEGYEGMNARTAIRAARDLDLVPLLRVRRWELTNKNRKTVLAAIEKRLDDLEAFDEPAPVYAAASMAEAHEE